MWIMLLNKLSTDPSPPKLSLFWSTPWLPESPNSKLSLKEWEMLGGKPGDLWINELDTFQLMRWGIEEEVVCCREPLRLANWGGARRIRYVDSDIRVFPHEYSAPTAEAMREFVMGGSHVLEAGGVAEDVIVRGVLRGRNRPLYEQALLAGCTHAQAMATAMGVDITLPDVVFPAIGWYRCIPEYAAMFCESWEMDD